jgi:hypothetical protein
MKVSFTLRPPYPLGLNSLTAVDGILNGPRTGLFVVSILILYLKHKVT